MTKKNALIKQEIDLLILTSVIKPFISDIETAVNNSNMKDKHFHVIIGDLNGGIMDEISYGVDKNYRSNCAKKYFNTKNTFNHINGNHFSGSIKCDNIIVAYSFTLPSKYEALSYKLIFQLQGWEDKKQPIIDIFIF